VAFIELFVVQDKPSEIAYSSGLYAGGHPNLTDVSSSVAKWFQKTSTTSGPARLNSGYKGKRHAPFKQQQEAQQA
jgi:hypothetical protein